MKPKPICTKHNTPKKPVKYRRKPNTPPKLRYICLKCIYELDKKNRGVGTTRCSFNSARARCSGKYAAGYENYGGRGIKFLFANLAELITEIGERPVGTSLDRIDSNGNYEKGNVRWVDSITQNRNTRSNRLSLEDAKKIKEYASKGFTNRQMADFMGVNIRVIQRVVKGSTWYE